MKIDDLDYLASLTAENSIILNGGVSAVASSSSFSEASPDGVIVSTNGFASATGKITYTLVNAQVRTRALTKGAYIAIGSAHALAYASG